MRILISGSREYNHYEFLRDMIEDAAGENFDVVIIHGAARGADRLGGKAAEEYGFKVEAYPADWSTEKAGSLRNSEMLSKDIDLALFFFSSSTANVGTRNAARKAVSIGIDARFFIDEREYTLSEIKRQMRPF